MGWQVQVQAEQGALRPQARERQEGHLGELGAQRQHRPVALLRRLARLGLWQRLWLSCCKTMT